MPVTETMMSLSKQRTKESIISALLLLILISIGVIVFLQQFNADISRFGMQGSISLVETQKPQTPDIAAFTPEGFKTSAAVSIYNEDNLYEKIDGKAPFYTESGFQKLFTQRFVSNADDNLWFELYMYDMGNIRNAFCVYSTQRRADVKREPALNAKFNYKTSNGLYFVCGKYYLELVGSAESNQLTASMLQTSAKFVKTFDTGKDNIEELALFPRENLVEDSFKMELADGLGFNGWKNLFSAKYNLENKIVTIFLNKQPDPVKANETAENYCKFLVDSGGEIRQPINKEITGKVLDVYNVFEVVLTKGNLVLGIHEADNQQLAEKAVIEIIRRIK